MANYKTGYFVIPVNENDKVVKIRDKFGDIRFSINPVNITILYVDGVNINIKSKSSNNKIVIDFATPSEAKIGLTELQYQIDIIKNRIVKEEDYKEALIDQLDTDGVDFVSIYNTSKTGGDVVSPTASFLEQRITGLVKSISNDIVKVTNVETIKLKISPISLFSEENNQHYDILNYTFLLDSSSKVNVYINGVYLEVGSTINDIAYFSKNGIKSDHILSGSKLWINPYLLGYDIDTGDIISVSYLKKT
jgi:hypothetical protein